MSDLTLATDYIENYNDNKPENEKIKILTLEILQANEAEGYEIDFTRTVVEDEDGDFKILRVLNDISILDEDGEPIFYEDDESSFAVVMYKDEVLAFASDFEDQDYYETMGYFCGVVDSFNRSQEFINWLKEKIARTFKEEKIDGIDEFKLALEDIANKFGVEIEETKDEE